MADAKNVTRFIIDGQEYVIPQAGNGQKGLMSSADYAKLQAAQANVLEGVKVNGTALSIAGKLVDILIAEGSANGKIAVNGVDVAVKGLAAMAYAAEVSEAELAQALKDKINAKAESSTVTTLSGKIDKLNGEATAEGSVKKMIADAFTTFTADVSNDSVINTFKELVDWVAAHDGEGGVAQTLTSSIAKVEAALGNIGKEGNPSTVQAAINAAVENAVNDLDVTALSNRLTSVETGLTNKVEKREGYDLSKNDFTDALLAKLNAIADGANKTTVSYDEEQQTLTITGVATA